jgi:hypothetical protein
MRNLKFENKASNHYACCLQMGQVNGIHSIVTKARPILNKLICFIKILLILDIHR